MRVWMRICFLLKAEKRVGLSWYLWITVILVRLFWLCKLCMVLVLLVLFLFWQQRRRTQEINWYLLSCFQLFVFFYKFVIRWLKFHYRWKGSTVTWTALFSLDSFPELTVSCNGAVLPSPSFSIFTHFIDFSQSKTYPGLRYSLASSAKV